MSLHKSLTAFRDPLYTSISYGNTVSKCTILLLICHCWTFPLSPPFHTKKIPAFPSHGSISSKTETTATQGRIFQHNAKHISHISPRALLCCLCVENSFMACCSSSALLVWSSCSFLRIGNEQKMNKKKKEPNRQQPFTLTAIRGPFFACWCAAQQSLLRFSIVSASI